METLKKFADKAALNYEEKPDKWVTLSYKQYFDLAVSFGKALIALGITNYTAVNIIGFNSYQWAVAFSGSIFGHYLPIGIYTTNGP
jgi:long-chain-fatty-acid--CoA ligase ACSBG